MLNLFYLSLCSLGGIIATMPVLVCEQYVNQKSFTLITFILLLTLLWSLLTIIYLYFIFHKVEMGIFFPIIKLIEIFIPILVSILFYKDQYNKYNYFGFLTSFIAIILLSR
jgi:multidrug transporter EmrE-like cation transporter